MNKTIQNLRIQNNYSQVAVASFLGISRQMYIKYENGSAIPPVKIVVELAGFYRVPYDFIIDDKFNPEKEQKQAEVTYQIQEPAPLELHDSGSAYNPSIFVNKSDSLYLKAIFDMLPKLVYREQLKLLEKLSALIQQATEERLKPDKKMQAYQALEDFANSLQLKSNGRKWTRDELYER